MKVSPGETVLLKDGRTVLVVEVASQEPDDYRLYSIDAYVQDGSFVLKDEMPFETIFIGTNMATGGTVVTDMSEVASILEVG
jgi:hypothetical protein